MKPITWNPIFLREMRDAMRAEAKSDPWRISLLLVFGLVGGALFLCAGNGFYHANAPAIFYHVLALIQTIIVGRPMEPTSALQKERQQNTFYPLFLTPLTPGRYLLGQLLAQLSVAFYRISALVPLFAACYVLGGFSLSQFLLFQLLLFVYLLAANSMMMALANMQQAQAEALASSSSPLLKSLSQRRPPNLAVNLNPLLVFSYILFPFAFLLIQLAVQGRLTLLLSTLGTATASPGWDFLMLPALIHPVFALVLWGDLLLFGIPFPVWLVCIVFWVLVILISSLTFIHQITLRKFRQDRGYRFARVVFFSGLLVLLTGIGWRNIHATMLLLFALSSLYALMRFGNPIGVPVRDSRSWQILPRRDLLVHHAGNLIPFLPLLMLPAWTLHALLCRYSPLPGVGLAVFYLNAEVFLVILILLTGGLIVRIGRLEKEELIRRKSRQEALEPAASTTAAEEGEKTKPKSGSLMNPFVGGALILWIAPLILQFLAPLAQKTPLEHAASVAAGASRPLLLLNPLRFVYLLLNSNEENWKRGLPLNLISPPASDYLTLWKGWSYYEASLASLSLLAFLVLFLYYIRARRSSSGSGDGDGTGRQTSEPASPNA